MSERLHELSMRHYSHSRVSKMLNKGQDGDFFKPKGLWVSVEDGEGWAEWCEAEGFDGGWEYVYDVELSPAANILHLFSVMCIDDFTREYGKQLAYPRGLVIDWDRVAKDYDGIVIAPYQWERRLDGEASRWYYPWDCASGCIWNAEAVSGLSRLVLATEEGA